jgi:hypothetical protein
MSSHTHENPSKHGSLIMGTESLFSCHLPMFFMPNHSYQTILEIGLNTTDMATYLKTRKENPGRPLITMNHNKMLLKEIVSSSSFLGDIFFAQVSGDPDGPPLVESTTITVKKVFLFEHLNPNAGEYPETLTYYLYGKDSEFHLSHLLSKAPNFEQECDVTLSKELQDKVSKLDHPVTKISIPSLNERSKQPISVDPLTQAQYTIRTEDGTTGSVEIKTKYWINNGPLNNSMNM